MIYTYTGRRVDLLHLTAADIDIRDIAHHLALCNRFAGATRQPISVAQHSVNCARLCACHGPAVQLQAELHDGSEGLIGDVTKWLKATPVMAGYRELEAQIQGLIYRVFGCAAEDHEAVKAADRLLVRYEMLQGFGKEFTVAKVGDLDSMRAYYDLTPADITWFEECCGPWEWWTWQRAERAFLDMYEQLTGKPVERAESNSDWSPVWHGLTERTGR